MQSGLIGAMAFGNKKGPGLCFVNPSKLCL